MTPRDAVELALPSGGRSRQIEALSATRVPRFPADQVVVTLAVGNELFNDDGQVRADRLDLVEHDLRHEVERAMGALAQGE